MKKSFEDLLEYIKNNTSSDYNELLEKAQEERKRLNRTFWVMAIIIDIILIYVFLHVLQEGTYLLKFIVIFPIFIADLMLYIILSLCFSKNKKAYMSSFKENIIQKLLCNFYSNVDYIPQKQMPRETYNLASYNEYYNRYYSDDYMEGLLLDKYFIKMAEVLTQEEETHTDSDGHTHTTTTTKFHGLFSQIKMEKSINSNLLIRRNHSIIGKNRLEMDSDEFEKYFDVSSTNQIIGMQLLTHDIMELLVSFEKTTKIKYDISIYNNIMYLRFHTGTMFEGWSFKKGAFNEEILRKYYNVLDFTYTLSKMLIELIEKTEI